MSRGVQCGAMLAVLLIAGCRSARQTQSPTATPPAATASATRAPSPPQAMTAPRGFQALTLTMVVPQEAVDRAASEGSCPRTYLIALFGADFANPHGCVIGEVTPGGPAQRAGLQVNDRIAACNGEAVTCPRTMLPVIQQALRRGDGKLTLSVHRPVAKPGAGQAAPQKGS